MFFLLNQLNMTVTNKKSPHYEISSQLSNSIFGKSLLLIESIAFRSGLIATADAAIRMVQSNSMKQMLPVTPERDFNWL